MTIKDKYGNEISPMEWKELFADNEYSRVERSELDDWGVTVSTVWLGLTFNDFVFETMVFGGKLDQELIRWQTLEEAEKGHRAMVNRVKEAHAGTTREKN